VDGAPAPIMSWEPAVVMPSAVESGRRAISPTDRFDDLFRALYPGLFGLTYRLLGDQLETEDTLQEAFVKLARDPVLARPDDEVAAWLRRVCLNLAANRLRGRRRARARLERVGRLEQAQLHGDAASPAQVVLRREQRAEVRRALARLPDRQRDCLLLRHSGHSYAEIAASLGIAVGSVGVILARAERAFRAVYRELNHEESDGRLP
jgi:RNA polymerase sigma factor (sigma-70 family)